MMPELKPAQDDLLKQAAKIAREDCLVPPDGGCPTQDETDMCERIAKAIEKLGMTYEDCPNCSGSGLHLNFHGEPDECPDCHGNTVIATRPDGGDSRQAQALTARLADRLETLLLHVQDKWPEMQRTTNVNLALSCHQVLSDYAARAAKDGE